MSRTKHTHKHPSTDGIVRGAQRHNFRKSVVWEADVHDGLPNQTQSTVADSEGFFQALFLHAWGTGIPGGGGQEEEEDDGRRRTTTRSKQASKQANACVRRCIHEQALTLTFFEPPRPSTHSLIMPWWRRMASFTISRGGSIFQRHSVPTGFLWWRQQNVHLFAQASDGVASMHWYLKKKIKHKETKTQTVTCLARPAHRTPPPPQTRRG